MLRESMILWLIKKIITKGNVHETEFQNGGIGYDVVIDPIYELCDNCQ